MPLDEDAAVVERIRARFARRGLTMPDINRRQALVPRGATLLDNPNGTAPGLWIEHGRTAVVLLPGPPREMMPMFEAVVRDWLAPRAGGAALFRRVLKITGRSESDVDACAQPIYGPWTSAAHADRDDDPCGAGPDRAAPDGAARASRDEADAVLDAAVEALRRELGDAVYSTDGRPLEAVVGDLLRTRRLTIAAAESCTGGLLLSRLTDVPGSSDYVRARRRLLQQPDRRPSWLGVPEALIAEHGAVSEPVARAMADRIRQKAGSRSSASASPASRAPAAARRRSRSARWPWR